MRANQSRLKIRRENSYLLAFSRLGKVEKETNAEKKIGFLFLRR